MSTATSGSQDIDSVLASPWIAVEPPRSGQCNERSVTREHAQNPPSFDQSRFDVILRRQRQRPQQGGGLKSTTAPSRFLNLSNDFEFSGWGTISNVELRETDFAKGNEKLEMSRKNQSLGQFTASALAANDILGGVFYALPAVVAVSSVYSPVSLFIATLTLFVWRPIMEELASALPISGAPYTYLLNVSTKSSALVAAALMLLDFAATAVISAATVASYLAGEVSLPFPTFVGTILVLAVFSAISFCGIKESFRVALGVLVLHVVTTIVLVIASVIAWARIGNTQIKLNWHSGQAPNGAVMAKQIFEGVCIGMLGLTGFECAPTYISRIKPGRYPLVLRNLHYPAIVLNTIIMLVVIAVLPLDAILKSNNILSVLGQVAGGKWLRLWVVVDAVVVLCGGVLTGIVSACELLEQLSRDRVIPKIFLSTLPVTHAPHIAISAFITFCGIIYASSGARLDIISKMFSLVWLSVMILFPLSLMLLRFNRGRLPRLRRTPLSVIMAALIITPIVFGGVIAIDPTTAGYFIAYFLGTTLFFITSQNKIHLLRWVYWAYDQYPHVHSWFPMKMSGSRLSGVMTKLRRQPVCIFAKTDEINHLTHMILYVKENEETTCVKIVHFCDDEKGVPSEMEANAKILDEAFPEITIDLILIGGEFNPSTVAALEHRICIPRSLMFMNCPGEDFPFQVSDFGARIISL